jgi:chaperonin cofactor prefoldin
MQEKILYHINKRQPEKIGIEAFQAQSLIVTFLKSEMRKRGIYADIEEITQTGDKLSKIRKLIPLYKN